MDLVSDLGLRYPPTSRQDEEGRAGLLALLGQDLADIPPTLLEMASREWVRTKAFMPKASELRALSHTLRRAHDIASQARLPAPRCEDPPRPTSPLTKTELQSMVDASPASLSGNFFQMGLNAGFILHLGGGRYQERGGAFTVLKSGLPGQAAA